MSTWLAIKKAELLVEKFVRLFLDNYVRAYKIMMAIVTDRDIYFQSLFWEPFTNVVSTKYKFSMGFLLQTDRLVEKANNIMQIFLHTYASTDPNE
jgi:hypothetical protein